MNTTLPTPGTTIATRAFGPFYTHFGIVSDYGLVIHASKRHGYVVEESISEFTQGENWWISNIKGNKSADEVITLARSYIGTPWTLFNLNCEHFVRIAHGLKKQCNQIRLTVASLLIYIAIGRK
ncbi:MAG: lecithin retinol acyltransferase family protein [Magnetospirillum sp.]|nr:lecithin retinol acyltransferase family protein [Magnetospirillum sp.]